MRDDKSEYMILKNRAYIGADDGTYEWALNEIDRLRTNIEVALQHALNHRKDNGCKADDQLGVIAIVLATTLEKIDRSAVRWHSTAALGEGKE